MIIRLFKLFGVIFLIAVVVALSLPPVTRGREAALRTQCKNNLKQLGLALHNYHDTYKVFPPAYTVDANGNPLHSWRTLILPYLDQQKLYETIDLSKPWNDPANAEAFKTVVPGFSCPSNPLKATSTTYLAVVTPESALRPIQSCKITDITDGTSNTLMVIEVIHEKAVHWMTPVDADEEVLLAKGVTKLKSHVGGGQGTLADGSVRFLSDEMPYEQIHALATVNGEEIVGDF